MKRHLVVVLSALAAIIFMSLAGCSGDSTSSSTTVTGTSAADTSIAAASPTPNVPTPTPQPQPSPTIEPLPSNGGTLPAPSAGALSATLTFAPGGPANNVVTLVSSQDAPVAAARASAQGDVDPNFLYISMTCSQPTPLKLLSKVLVNGSVPINISSLAGSVVDPSTNQVLGSLPGPAASDGTTATFNGTSTDTVLQPNKSYVMKFGGTAKTVTRFRFSNKSGVAGDMYVMVTAFGPNFPTDQKFYHLNKKLQLVADAMTDGTPNGNPDQVTADYGIKVNEGNTISLPAMNGPRLYVAMGSTIKVNLQKNTTNTAPQQPVLFLQPDLTGNPNDPCYNTLIDFLELTILPETVGINMTEVNSIGIPMIVTVDGIKNGVSHQWQVGFKSGARQAIFQGLANDPDYKTLAVPPQANPDPGAKTLRFLNPSYGVYNVIAKKSGVGTFNANYYKSYIDQVWTYYKTHQLTAITDVYGTFTGQVNNNDVFVFNQTTTGQKTPPVTTYTVAKPMAYDSSMPSSTDPDTIGTYAALVNDHGVFQGSPVDNVGRQIGGAMGIAICRSTLLNFPIITRNYPPYTDCPVSQYYTQTPINSYGKLIHDWSVDSADKPDGANNWGGAYAFGLDDNCNQSSVLNVTTPNTVNNVTVTIQPFQ